MSETIFSLSTGGLPSGVAVIRISGSGTRFAFETICGSVPEARHAAYRVFRDSDGQPIDRGLALYFPAPASFTGEECGEFHLHGSRAVVARFLEVLSALDGFRQAEAGEFTRRAFDNGKMDLTAVEGLSDLLAAETEMQRRAALDQAGGHLNSLYEGWMHRLTHCRAMLEADFDFADEEDVPGTVADQVWPDITALKSEIEQHIQCVKWGETIRDGFRVALVGAPNVGKSTLLNRLADRDVAIVSDRPGTTRDSIEVRLDIGGHLVRVIDTAGLRETEDEVESEGIRRSLRMAEAADLILLLDDGNSEIPDRLPDVPCIRVHSKSDIRDVTEGPGSLSLSAVSGEGVRQLIDLIARELAQRSGRIEGLPNRQRHETLLREAVSRIEAGLEARVLGSEIAASELMAASEALGRITGRVNVEDLLGVIFSQFCIGK
ncbi:tRNA uridine-5-carboxymethylaminomethyl(34) synthesis GTPase MnmE [Pseudohoeflea suaedae]|uniref:tRNA modification GTPase MnmE n=1 Tax=Pseudohoeflea suaedae TaxID=877384 RepID=A0A4R5PMP5_9HYPH|nr:tRNA uridine-5-carboxymethylaminomethyl(34) synthesis GTPase MnmE [Pseudohoeflea suaedae]TDH37811.1 tRNA uridine-5-carboxymethylaminomethyl(34) synthesis GTPase MnmE [Pseudohoeflea suaedae]